MTYDLFHMLIGIDRCAVHKNKIIFLYHSNNVTILNLILSAAAIGIIIL